MKIVTARAVLSLASIGSVRSFAIPTTRAFVKNSFTTGTSLQSSTDKKADDYDDWYSDFDPSKFDEPASAPAPSRFDDVPRRDSGGDRGGSRGAPSRGGGGGYGGGAGSGGHDYSRDTNADNSNVNLDQVNAMIADRLEARKTGRFGDADAIRDQLLDDHGVSVWDKDKQWRSGSSRSGSGKNFGGRQDSRGGRDGGRDSRGGPRKQRDFGPNGHDYEISPGAGPNTSSLSETEIHRMIAERLQFKMVRDFREADAIQGEFEKFGISVHDGRKEWRADGERFGGGDGDRGGRPGREAGSRADRFRPYEKSEHSEETNDLEQIMHLIEERTEAKKARAFQDADEIQDELRKNFNVEVNDKTRQWSVGGDFGIEYREASGPYVMASVSQATDESAEIQSLVDEREEARKQRDFDTADDVKDQLINAYNVVIDDKLRQWSVGGGFDSGRGPPNTAPFVRRGGGTLTEADEATIIALIEERNEAKKDREFGKADRIRDQLGDDYLVRVDDRSREWRVVSDEYIMSPASAIDDETKAFIQKKIGERSVAKLQKNYDVADDIREELSNNYNVFLDDRVKEWSIDGAEPVSANEVSNQGGEAADDENDSMFDVEVDDLDAAMDSAFGEEDIDFSSLTVPELKEKLRAAGLPVGGNKTELIQRLSNGGAEISDDSEEEVDEEAGEEVDESEDEAGEDLSSLKVDDLKVKLRDAGLPVSGSKAELIQRLTSQ